MARYVILVLAIVSYACGDETERPASTEASETPAASEDVAEPPPSPAPTAEPATPGTRGVRVATEGLTVHTSLTAPDEVLDVAHETRPRSIAPVLTAGAGAAPGARVYWLAYLTSPLSEVRGHAEDEGRVEAWDAELERRIAECEANEELPEDCYQCDSLCWREVPESIASRTRQLRLVRVSWPRGAGPVVDASEVVWTIATDADVRVRARSIEDMDGDGRLELSLGIQAHNEWPSGDGGDDSRVNVYVDGDTARVQLLIPRSFEEDGHGGSSSHETQVTFRDRNGDGVRDFAIRFQRHVGLQECQGYGEEEPPPGCEDLDESHVATYSSEHDEWRLPEGETWPWLRP